LPGVPKPHIDAIVNTASAATKPNFWEEGRSLKNLGLEGKNVSDIVTYMQS
jgi:hypothetical protein